jgi:flagella basal body P-ring formation protein FlgA
MLVKALTAAGVLMSALAGQTAQPVATEPGIQPLASIRAAAVSALRAELGNTINKSVELEAAPLDARLRLPVCAGEPAGTATQPRTTQVRAIVRVSCASPLWTLNVPVEMRRRVAVLVLKRPVGRGENIAADAVESQIRLLPGLATPFVGDIADLKGRLTRRPLSAGTAVTAEALTAAFVVHRGQSVMLAANSNGLEVRAPGTALADAAAHQRVRVQNAFSLKIVEGVAESEGIVRVIP